MKIALGSLNRTKINAVKAVFENTEIITKAVPSGVSVQPIGDEETMAGAINRARSVKEHYPNHVGIGLEGGVMLLHDSLYLCNWGALVTDEGKVYTAGGARIQLPEEFKESLLLKEAELSDVMDDYTRKKDIRLHEGAIGIFTNGRVLRHDMFTHVVTLLKGQLEYWK